MWEAKHLEASQIQAAEQLRPLIQAAQDSQHLLSSPVLATFFSDIEKKCFEAADKLPLGDTKGRDRAYTLVHLSRKLKAQLDYYATNGQFWQEQLDSLLKPTPKQEGDLYG